MTGYLVKCHDSSKIVEGAKAKGMINTSITAEKTHSSRIPLFIRIFSLFLSNFSGFFKLIVEEHVDGFLGFCQTLVQRHILTNIFRFFISRTLSAFQFERLARFDVIVEGADVDFCCFHHIIKGILKDLEMSVIVEDVILHGLKMLTDLSTGGAN